MAIIASAIGVPRFKVCVCVCVCRHGPELRWRDMAVRDLKEIGVPENRFVELAQNRVECRRQNVSTPPPPPPPLSVHVSLSMWLVFSTKNWKSEETCPILPPYLKVSSLFHRDGCWRFKMRACVRAWPYGAVDFQSKCGLDPRWVQLHTSFFSFSVSGRLSIAKSV